VTTIYLVRHCEFENPEKVVPFRLPGFPLNTKGKRGAKLLADYFKDKKIAAIYSSPLLRAKQTTELIASKLNLKVQVSPLLLETKTPLQGMKREEFFRKYDFIFGEEEHLKRGGEAIEEVNTRVKKFIKGILKKHSNQKVVVISHGDPLMVIQPFLLRGKLKEAPGAVIIIFPWVEFLSSYLKRTGSSGLIQE